MQAKKQITNLYIDKHGIETKIRTVAFCKQAFYHDLGKFKDETPTKHNFFVKRDKNYIYQDHNFKHIAYKITEEAQNQAVSNELEIKFIKKLKELQPNIKLTKFPTGIVTLENRVVGQEIIYLNNYITLANYLEEHKLTEDIINKIIEILLELYENNVLYNDIHPNNFMINPENKDVQLIDFEKSQVNLEKTEYTKEVFLRSVKAFFQMLKKYFNIHVEEEKVKTIIKCFN